MPWSLFEGEKRKKKAQVWVLPMRIAHRKAIDKEEEDIRTGQLSLPDTFELEAEVKLCVGPIETQEEDEAACA